MGDRAVPISLACPTCGERITAPEATAGKSCKCPKCGATVAVPVAVPPNAEFTAEFDDDAIVSEFLSPPRPVRRPHGQVLRRTPPPKRHLT